MEKISDKNKFLSLLDKIEEDKRKYREIKDAIRRLRDFSDYYDKTGEYKNSIREEILNIFTTFNRDQQEQILIEIAEFDRDMFSNTTYIEHKKFLLKLTHIMGLKITSTIMHKKINIGKKIPTLNTSIFVILKDVFSLEDLNLEKDIDDKMLNYIVDNLININEDNSLVLFESAKDKIIKEKIFNYIIRNISLTESLTIKLAHIINTEKLDIDNIDDNEVSNLGFAIANKLFANVRFLVENGADVNRTILYSGEGISLYKLLEIVSI